MTAAHPHRPPQRPDALAEAHPCPVAGCTTPVSPGHVSCREHWQRVPSHLRERLVVVFRNRKHNPAAYEVGVGIARELVERYGGEAS